MLKRKITKADHETLSPELQKLYKAEGDDFILQVDGIDDPAELRRARDREVEERKTAQKRVKELETELATKSDTDARSKGDIATLEKSWQAKLDSQKKEYEAKLDSANKHLQSTLVDAVAQNLSVELGGDNSALLLPHIKTRLSADLSGETPLTRVLDKDGKLSAFSVEDLKKEFSGDTRFKAVIVGSRGSGGGAAGAGIRPNGGAGTGQKKFNELNDAERNQWYKDDPKGFEEASAANKQALLESRTAPRMI